MGAPALATGLNTFQPVCFWRGRNGDIFFANGLDRPRRFDGVTTSAELAGITAPSGVPTITPGSGGGATAGTYVFAVQYIDDTLPDAITSDISTLVTATLTANQKAAWSNIPVSSEARVTQKRLWMSTSGEAETLYLVTTIANATTSYSGFTGSDTTLATQTFLPILQPNGDLNARRFAPPPDDKPYACMFQDRVFMAGRVAYNVGTVAVNGSTTVTGTSTAWTTQMAGRYIYIDGEPAPLVISAVGSATSITLTTAATTTASGKSYTLIPSPKLRNTIFFSEDDEPESFGGSVTTLGVSELTNEVTIQDNTGDEDDVTGLMPYGAFLYVLKERHIYSLKFIRQPKIDIGINCIAWRGCLNHRCWTIMDGIAYVMDQTGIYRFTGSSPEPIDAPIQNQFFDGTIDFTVAKWFWVAADTARKLVYFAVSYTADSSTRPKRVLVYNAILEQWMPEQYIWEVGGGAVIPISGKARLLLGAENDLVLATGQGTSDMVTAVRGTTTAAGSTTLSDTTNSPFTSAMVDAPLAIVAGTGAGQLRRISARNSSSQVTVSQAWTTTPDTTSVYVVGAIQWNHKSSQFELPAAEKRYSRKVYLAMQPTTHTNYVGMKQYANKYTTPSAQQVSEDRGTGVLAAAGAYHTFDITLSRVSATDSSGVQSVALPGFCDPNSNAQRWLAVEFFGFQGQDSISMDRYVIEGVTQ